MTRILNRLNKQGYKKEINLFVTFLFSAAIIWFAGRVIHFGQHAPLHSVRRRLFVITLVYFVMAGYAILRRRKQRIVETDATIKNETGSWQKCLSFFKKIIGQDSKIRLNHLPWFLLIGPEGSGKTALMNNSQIPFIPKEQVAAESLAALAEYGAGDWWLTPDAVLLDVSKNYFSNSPDVRWLNLFNKKWRGRNTVSGIVVSLPLSDLTEIHSRAALVENLKQRVIELKEKFGADVPFYFTLTKCDLLPGFLDFFAHSGTDELGQAWGITLPHQQPVLESFINRFNALIKRLNKQLIWRLHQERGTFERVFIKDFPLQIERLKEILIDVLHSLTKGGNDFALQGVYLTSAVQHSAPEQLPHATIDASSTAMQIMHVPAMPSRSYFIRQFLLQGLSSHYGQRLRLWQKRPVVYALCASVITLTIAFLGYDIFYSKKMLAMQDTVVSTFNIVIPQDKPEETQIGDLTIVR
jgi:type VI secretion system protein ImpL